MTGAGVTNYGIKKLLPRIIIAAVLVNISFYICQIAVDLSNVVGFGIKDMLNGLGEAAGGGKAIGTGSTSFGGMVTTAVGLGVGTAALWASIGSLIPVVIGSLFAVVMILLILAGRQALIVMLVIVSPLAFVAFLLPNTQDWFTKWRKMFTAMLLLFPIVALVFGASDLAADILSSTFAFAGAAAVKSTTPAGATFMQIIAAGVRLLPLFIVPGLLKKALDGVGTIGAKMNAIGDKVGGAAGKKFMSDTSVGQAVAYKDKQAALRRAQTLSGTYKGKGLRAFPRNVLSRVHGGINNRTGKFGSQRSAQGAALADAEDAELVKNAGSKLDAMESNGAPLTQDQMMAIATGKDMSYKDEKGNAKMLKASSVDSATKRAAIERAVKKASVGEAMQLVDASGAKNADGTNTMDGGARSTLVSALAGSSLVGKAPFLGGKTLGHISAGELPDGTPLTAMASAKRSILEGGFTAETIAGNDKATIETAFAAATEMDAGGDSRGMEILADANSNFQNSEVLRPKVADGSDVDQVLRQIPPSDKGPGFVRNPAAAQVQAEAEQRARNAAAAQPDASTQRAQAANDFDIPHNQNTNGPSASPEFHPDEPDLPE